MFGSMTALVGLHVTGEYKDKSMQHACSRHAAWDPHRSCAGCCTKTASQIEKVLEMRKNGSKPLTVGVFPGQRSTLVSSRIHRCAGGCAMFPSSRRGLWVSGLGFRVSRFGVRAQHFGFWVKG